MRSVQPLLAARPSVLRAQQLRPHTRAFVSPLHLTPEVQTLTHSRTLPYPPSHVFAIIADIGAYASFLPYCTSSRVLRTAGAHPSLASLTVGFSGYEERLTSRVFCTPHSSVEACTGDAKPSLPVPAGALPPPSEADETGLFAHLLTTWTLSPFPYKPPPAADGATPQPAREQTEIRLRIEYALRNPVYAAMAAAVGEGVGGKMVDAFERQAGALWAREGRGNRELGERTAVEGVWGGSGAGKEQP